MRIWGFVCSPRTFPMATSLLGDQGTSIFAMEQAVPTSQEQIGCSTDIWATVALSSHPYTQGPQSSPYRTEQKKQANRYLLWLGYKCPTIAYKRLTLKKHNTKENLAVSSLREELREEQAS